MTHFRLAVNRFPEPEVWLRIVGDTLGVRYAQVVDDLKASVDYWRRYVPD